MPRPRTRPVKTSRAQQQHEHEVRMAMVREEILHPNRNRYVFVPKGATVPPKKKVSEEVAFVQRSVNDLAWENIKEALGPAADIIQEAVKKTLVDLMEDEECKPLEKMGAINKTFEQLLRLQASVIAARTKEKEKPHQTAVQINFDDNGARKEALRVVQAQANLSSLDALAETVSKSHPPSEAGHTPEATAPPPTGN